MTFKELEQCPPVAGYWDVRSQLRDHIYSRSKKQFACGDAARDAIKSRGKLERRQKGLRRFFHQCLGGLPSCDTPLNAHTVGVVEGNGFKIEKVIFESRPNTFVTANLYLPVGVRGPQGAVLFLCGHHEQAKHAAEYQGVCQKLVQAGLIVFAVDPIGQGERVSYGEAAAAQAKVRWGTSEHDYAGLQCLPLGDAIARYFLHDAMRAVDYMMSRPEIDPKKIGMTGNSGGGTQSSLMMLGDPRIAAAAPCTFIMNRETYMYSGGAQDAEQIWPGFTAAGYDHEDILLAMCPKPVRVLAVQYDFFPIEGVRRTVERARRIWKLFGKGSNLDLVEDSTVHWYTDTLARAAAEFFSWHLLGKKLGNKELPVTAFEPSKLWCTKTGQVCGEIEGARIVNDENRDRAREITTEHKAVRTHTLAWLRGRVFAHRTVCDLNPRFVQTVAVEELTADLAFWWSQEGLVNAGMFFRETARKDQRLPVTVAVWDGGCTVLEPHAEWIRSQCRAGRAVLVLETSGVGSLLPHPLNQNQPLAPYGVMHKFADDLAWLDDSLPALRTFDVTRAFDLIGECPRLDAREIHCFAHGKQGVYAQIAAALDSQVKAIEVVGGIGSYAEFVRSRYYDLHDMKSIVFNGILQHCDLPNLMKWTKDRGTKVL